METLYYGEIERAEEIEATYSECKTKTELIEKIKSEEKASLQSFGYTEEETAFLDDIVDVIFFRGRPSRIILKNGEELYL